MKESFAFQTPRRIVRKPPADFVSIVKFPDENAEWIVYQFLMEDEVSPAIVHQSYKSKLFDIIHPKTG